MYLLVAIDRYPDHCNCYNQAMLDGERYRGKRVLVTGNTGFSGVWLCTMLEAFGAEIMGYSRDETDFSTLFEPKSVSTRWKTFFGELEDLESLRRVVRDFNPHLIFHLGAQSLVFRGFQNPIGTFSSNVMGTVNILGAAGEARALEGLVVITTDKVYKQGDDLRTEFSELSGSDAYSCSKVGAEEAVRAFRSSFNGSGVPICVMRGGNVIGGGDWSESRLVPDAIKASLALKKLRLRQPNSTRPWQHVLDLVFAYALVGSRMISGRGELVNSEFNVGPGLDSRATALEVVRKLKGFGWAIDFEFSPVEYKEAEHLSIDSTKLIQEVKWSPLLKSDDALHWTSDWYREVLINQVNAVVMTQSQVTAFLENKNAV